MTVTRYVLTAGRVVVTARSALHDTRCLFPRMTGEVDFDPAEPQRARAEIRLDLRELDAGDRLKTWKLRGTIAPERYPLATFSLARIDRFEELAGGNVRAVAVGTLAWHDHKVELRAAGDATITPRAIMARAQFDLDVRSVGVAPPKFLMFKIDEVVSVQVEISATAS